MSKMLLRKYLIILSLLGAFVLTVLFTVPTALVFFNLGYVVGDASVNWPWLIVLTNYRFTLFLIIGIVMILTERMTQQIKNDNFDEVVPMRFYWNTFFSIALVGWGVAFLLAYILTPILLFWDVL